MHQAAIIGFLPFFVITVNAQSIDTVLTWRDYSYIASARVRVYDVVDDKRKLFTAVIDERGQNKGSAAINDASYIIQMIGKDLNLEPTSVYWVFRWSIGSFDVDCTSPKEVMIMATMGRSKSNKLTGPSWRVIDAQRLKEMTDRQWGSG